jgi:thiamine biosynthesis lipoprotein
MGTLGEVAVVERDPTRARAALDAAFEALWAVEAAMSRFRPLSDVGRANRGAARAPVRVCADTAFVLDEALAWARATDGRFDPCLAESVRLWDVKSRTRPPATERVRALAGRSLYRSLTLDRGDDGGAVRFLDSDVGIDLGGIAKGFGVDQAVAALKRHGIEHALVNVGGDLFALGRAPDGDPWTVGVRDAREPARIAQTFHAEDLAVATSGDYQQYFDHRGRRYHHLLDPSTGAPRRTPVRSVTLTAARCLDADAAATAAFGLPVGAPEARVDPIGRGVRRLNVLGTES